MADSEPENALATTGAVTGSGPGTALTPAPTPAPAPATACGKAREMVGGIVDKAADTAIDWTEEAKAIAIEVKDVAIDKGAHFAHEGKAYASDALAYVGQALAGVTETLDQKFGVKYGDIARTAARSAEESADKLASRDFAELGEDIKDLVRARPVAALGVAAVAGFLVARMFRSKPQTETAQVEAPEAKAADASQTPAAPEAEADKNA